MGMLKLTTATREPFIPVLIRDEAEWRRVHTKFTSHCVLICGATVIGTMVVSLGAGEEILIWCTWIFQAIQEYVDYAKAL